MNCAVAIQYLPMDATSDEETCRVVDAVIAYIDSTGLDYYVGPFETTIEGSYDECMDVLKNCQLVGAQAGCGHVMTYAKIDYRPEGDVMSTEHKIGKYHEGDPEFATHKGVSAA
ncbi:MAG: thiamine-binding protein [Atopobiaceae bacterium]|nr:thiamine-binding protein [Atopobiaceae bacterium]